MEEMLIFIIKSSQSFLSIKAMFGLELCLCQFPFSNSRAVPSYGLRPVMECACYVSGKESDGKEEKLRNCGHKF